MKAEWVASLLAVTLLIFAAGAALDRSRLVRAASSSNVGRRHLELDVLVGVVTGTRGDGRRPRPGATDTDTDADADTTPTLATISIPPAGLATNSATSQPEVLVVTFAITLTLALAQH